MNHGFVIVPGSLSSTKLDTCLRQIVQERWGSLVQVVNEGQSWRVGYGDDYNFALDLWLESRRKIEMRKQLGQLSSWLQTFIQESLASRLNGKCSDEGSSRRGWVGKPQDFRTFRQWWDHGHSYYESNAVEQSITEAIFNSTVSGLPKAILE